MKELVSALNGSAIRTALAARPDESRVIRLRLSEPQMALRSLVELWMESGPDLRKMFADNPGLERRTRDGKTLFWPTTTGRGHLDWLPAPAVTDPDSPENIALMEFMTLITNPEWASLGGPCARCENYYLKKTKRQKTYCSRKCSSEETAVSATRKRRRHEQAKKIDIAQKRVAVWSKNKRLGWKEWVASKTGYSLRWISRAVNNGSLKPPHTAHVDSD